MLAVILENGGLVDGSGNPWFFGQVGIKNGVITHVGRADVESVVRIEAKGQVVGPGFIDGHCHSDLCSIASGTNIVDSLQCIYDVTMIRNLYKGVNDHG